MNSLVEMFSHPFMVRALIVGVLLAISAALIGTPLVLRRNSMLSDGLSHVAFGAFAIASALGLAPLPVAIPVVVLVSFFVLRISSNAKIHGDLAIALMSTSALAIGTLAVSLTGANVDINSYLFGSILSINQGEVWLSLGLFLVVSGLYIVFHNRIFALTFDEKFARAIGVNARLYNAVFAVLCSVLIVLGMRLMGALLISSLIIFPTLSASTVFRNFKSVTIFGAVLGALNFVIGLVLSYVLNTPTGATIVVTSLAVLVTLKVLDRLLR